MKVLVCGGRDYADKEFVFETLDSIPGITTIIHGAATGADSLGALWATEKGIRVLAVPANWKEYGKSAGPIRNREMLKLEPDLVVAFPGGKGTKDMMQVARKAGIKTIAAENCISCFEDFLCRSDFPKMKCCQRCVPDCLNVDENRCPNCGWDSDSVGHGPDSPVEIVNRYPDWEYGYCGGEHWTECWSCPECKTRFEFTNSSV